MNRVSKRPESRKRAGGKVRGTQAKAQRREDAPWAVRAPVYAASIGLFAVSAWGYLNAGLGGFAWGLVGVTAMSELLKPQLGELAAHALDAKDRTAQRIVTAAALVCVLLGAAGGIVAMHVAEAPRARHEAAERAVDAARGRAGEAQALVDAVPTCAPDMPASRCERMTAENGPILADRQARLAAARALEAEARATLDATPPPGAGLPRVELWHKALFIGGAEFLIFAVPFAALRLRRRGVSEAVSQSPQRAIKAPAPAAPIADAAKINDGGWASRRAKYGPSGRKPKRGGHLKIATA